MGLAGYFSHQPNQKAKSITQYDGEFFVATIFRFRDTLTSLFNKSPQIPFQKQHNDSKRKLLVNKTRIHIRKFTKHDAHIPNSSNNSLITKARVNFYNSKFISSINCHANHLLKTVTASALQIHITKSKVNSTFNSDNNINHITRSAHESAQIKSSTSPQTSQMAFQTQTTPNTNTSANNTRTSFLSQTRDIELPREKVFENNLNQLFTKSFFVVLTSRDAVLKEIRDCVLQGDEARCKEVVSYIHNFWKDLHVKSGCLCVDERATIPHSIENAVIESLHLTLPGIWGMISLSQYAWWRYMHKEILAKTSDCVPCEEIGKNLKPVIPKSNWHPYKACHDPNEEIQIDFGGPILN